MEMTYDGWELTDLIDRYWTCIETQARPVPQAFRRVAVVSNPRSDGYKDFCHTTAAVNHELFESKMGHSGFAEVIAQTLREINSKHAGKFDAICIVRGGGDRSEMAEYNWPVLLDAIVESRLPVLTAIGHAEDVHLADLVADHFFITPTALGATINSPSSEELWERLPLKEEIAKLRITSQKAERSFNEKCAAGHIATERLNRYVSDSREFRPRQRRHRQNSWRMPSLASMWQWYMRLCLLVVAVIIVMSFISWFQKNSSPVRSEAVSVQVKHQAAHHKVKHHRTKHEDKNAELASQTEEE